MNSNNELEMGVKKHKKNISLVWLAPIVAILITSGMIWKTYIDAGTRITIVIENGDGIREGKTPIMYKGIKVGTVEDIKIKEDDLSKLELTALIDKRAADGVAREGNQFWKVEPKISITEVSGLNTIVTGVYISVMPAVNNQDALHALPFQDHFVALQYTPVDVFNPGLSIIVNTVENGAMAVGAPVLYNEKAIGSIEDKRLSDDNKSIDLYLRIDTDYIGLVREKSAFYKADALDVKASLSGIQVNMASFASFIAGGVVLFNPDDAWLSPQAKDEDRFALYDNYQESAQSSDEIALIMHGHDNIMPEVTKVFYKGVEAGLVKTLKHDPLKDQTSISIRLNNDFRKLANEKAYFWVVKPRIGFDRIDGLDAIVRGNYINFITTDIEAKTNNTFRLHDKQPQMKGIRIDVIADDIESIREGAGLFYHNVEIGRVSSYRVNKDRKTFTISLLLRPKYKRLVNTSSMFYHNSGVDINAGFDGVNIKTGSLETVLRGGISVETPDFSLSQKLKDKYVLYNSRAELRKAQYLNGKGLALTLVSEQLGSLKKGSPVYYKQIKVGEVLSYKLDPLTKKVLLKVFITHEYAPEVHDNTLFYIASGIDAKFGLDGLEINTESFETIMTGGIAFYTPVSQEGKIARNEERFKLYATKSKAMKTYTDIVLYSKDSHGLVAGNLLMYKSVIIGHVSAVRLEKEGVELDLKVDSKYAYLLKEDTLFWPEAFEMSLQGIQNFSAALKGTFIVLKEGRSEAQDNYFFLLSKKPSVHFNEEGLRIVVQAKRLGGIKEDTPLYYRQIKIGSVSQYRLNDDATGVDIELFIEPCYAHLIRGNSYFYNASGIGMQIDLFSAKVKTETLDSILTGGIGVLTPDDFTAQAKEAQLFSLHEEFDESALKWAPKLRSTDPMCQ